MKEGISTTFAFVGKTTALADAPVHQEAGEVLKNLSVVLSNPEPKWVDGRPRTADVYHLPANLGLEIWHINKKMAPEKTRKSATLFSIIVALIIIIITVS